MHGSPKVGCETSCLCSSSAAPPLNLLPKPPVSQHRLGSRVVAQPPYCLPRTAVGVAASPASSPTDRAYPAKRSTAVNGSPDSCRRLTAALVLAGVCVLPIACGNSNTSHPSARPSIAEVPLDRLLLSPTEVNTAMGGTEMTVSATFARTNDDSAKVADANCRAISDVAEASGSSQRWPASWRATSCRLVRKR